jgi:hypothetical protein
MQGIRKEVVVKFEIKSRCEGKVLFSLETESLKLCVEAAAKSGANLYRANLSGADLPRANLSGANLYGADLYRANLSGAKNMFKTMGVEHHNRYWKRFDKGLNNNGYQFKVGLNVLREGEKFADDERINCSYPGFHFASRSWCAMFYPTRPLEAKILIPRDAKINEPWGTDGKASADKIKILQVFDVKTGEDVTEQYR